MYSKICTPTNPAPQMIVMSSQNLRPPSCSLCPGTLRRKYFFPSAIAAYAFTIDTDEQISRKVLMPVSGTLSTAPGLAHASGMPKRSTMYEPMSAVKNMTSLARNTHMPSFLLYTPEPGSAGTGGRIASVIAVVATLVSSRERRGYGIAIGGQLPGLRQEVGIGRFGRAELVRAAIHVGRRGRPVAVRRRVRQRPLEAVVVPRIHRRHFPLLQAPQEVEREQELHGEQREGAVGNEHVEKLLWLQEIVDRGIIDPAHLAPHADDVHGEERHVVGDQREPEV